MCWLHEKTNGRAYLPGCDQQKYGTYTGNVLGHGPVDYWLHLDDLPLWKVFAFRVWISAMMLVRGKHYHTWEEFQTATGKTLQRCDKCGQFKTINGE